MAEWLTRIDLWIIVVYLAAMLLVAVRVSRGSRDVEGYVVGNRSMSGIVLGVSVLGTFLSSITFLGLPAKTFKGDWNALVFGLALPAAALIATLFFVPLYRRRTRLSAFELLNRRFGAWARFYAVVSYLLLQSIRVGTVLLLVAFSVAPLLTSTSDAATDPPSDGPVAATSGGETVEGDATGDKTTGDTTTGDSAGSDSKGEASAEPSSSTDLTVMLAIIGVLGVLVIIYDTLGGIRAVIWTDVLQVVILLFGAFWCLGQMILTWEDGSFFAAVPADKVSLGQWTNWNSETNTWDWTIASVLVLLIYGLTENLRNYGSDQNYVQRMLAARSDGDAQVSIWLGALTYVPVSVVFCLIGTALWMHAHSDHSPLPAGLEADQAFPYFIRHVLPGPVAGLVIAAVLAAAMSTVDSSLNSCSTILLVDVVRPLRLLPQRIPEIVVVRGCTVIFGVVGTSMAMGLLYIKGQHDSKVLMDLWWQYAGTAGGGMFGLFLLAWLMPQIPGWVAGLGVVVSVPFLGWASFAQPDGRAAWLPEWLPNCPINPLLIGVAGTGIILLIGACGRAAVQFKLLPANTAWQEPIDGEDTK